MKGGGAGILYWENPYYKYLSSYQIKSGFYFHAQSFCYWLRLRLHKTIIRLVICKVALQLQCVQQCQMVPSSKKSEAFRGILQ